MAEPFKNLFNEAGIRGLGKHLKKHSKQFDDKGFVGFALEGLEGRELKQRSERITESLHRYLPEDFPSANELLLKTLHPEELLDVDVLQKGSYEKGMSGWMIMPMAQFVADHGMPHFDLSLSSLKEMTKRFSSEYAIRYFIAADTKRALAILSNCTDDDNYHVRRLVSEGTRSRLPWGIRLNDFVEDPTPVLPLLERLKDDPEEYVRRSVANNLNDISKDHPDLVANIAARWLKGASKDRTRLVRHACRGLIKSGHSGCLKALGYGIPKVGLGDVEILTPKVQLGKALEFAVTIASRSAGDQPLIVDYIVHHMKANGKQTPKVFKWKTMNLKAGAEVRVSRRHPMKKITTRVYYPGAHRVEVLVNGEVFPGADFKLEV